MIGRTVPRFVSSHAVTASPTVTVLVRGAIDAPLIGRDKLGAPLLGVPLAFEEPLLPLASPRIAPVQDVARLLDDRAILQLPATDAACEIDVERHRGGGR